MSAILATLLTMAAAHPVSTAGEWNCEAPATQAELNYCAHQEYKQADEILNLLWEQAAENAKNMDAAGGPDDGRPGYLETLLDGQRKWLAYRDAHCRMAGYEARSGSMEPMLVSMCLTRMTRQRIAELELLNGEI